MMKKYLIIALVIIGLVGGYLIYTTKENLILAPEHNAANDGFISTFFTYAREQIPTITAEIDELSKDVVKNQEELSAKKNKLNLYRAIAVIADRDIEGLKAIDVLDLSFNDQLNVSGDYFKTEVIDALTGGAATKGLFSHAMLGGQNALAFVVFNAARDKTIEDKQKTLKMLKLLLDKKLDPHAQAGLVFWIKDNPKDTHALDYIAVADIVEIAPGFAYPEVVKMLQSNG